MPRLVLASAAAAAPMGAQGYEEQLAARAESALREVDPSWQLHRLVFRSVRSDLPGTGRLPMGWLTGAGRRSRAVVGRVVYPPGAVVHRTALELPPGPIDVVTLHDVVAWRFGDESPPVRAAAAELRSAAAVVCVSEFTAGEARDLLGLTEVRVVPNGVAGAFFDAIPLDAAALAGLGLPRRFVLHAGGAARRKTSTRSRPPGRTSARRIQTCAWPSAARPTRVGTPFLPVCRVSGCSGGCRMP